MEKIKLQKIIIRYFCFFNDFDELMNYLNYIENNIVMMEENKILFWLNFSLKKEEFKKVNKIVKVILLVRVQIQFSSFN